MPLDRWFPKNYELPNGRKLKSLVESAEYWQIFKLDDNNKALVATEKLADRWISEGYLEDGQLSNFEYGDNKYKYLVSDPESSLSSLNSNTSPESKADAVAFAISLRESRKLSSGAALHDAIYVERYSRLLPTWTVSEKLDDDVILGKWLTGGVTVSSKSERRLVNLMGWLPKDQVREIIEVARNSSGGTELEKGDDQINTGPKENSKSLANGPVKEVQEDSDIQNKGMFRLPGRPNLESFFNEHVVDIIQNKKRYQALGIDFPTAIVLYGPPGCGKTFAVEQLVEFLDWPIFYIDSNSVGSPYIHETSKKVSEIFDKAVESSPAAVVIDEMESYLSDRQISQGSGLHHVEEVAEFLRRIPQATENEILVIGMTNRLEMIDPAILRRGRFDHVIEVGMPSRDEVYELVSSLIGRLPKSESLDLESVVNALTGRALSDASFLIREACRLAAKAGKPALDQESLNTGMSMLPPVESDSSHRPIGFV